MSKEIVSQIKEIAKDVYDNILKLKQPHLKTPIRSLSNVSYNAKKGYFEIGSTEKTRTLTASTIRTFAQTLRMIAFSKTLVETNDISTKRETYYIAKNWGPEVFKEQSESDSIIDDIEAMLGVNREQIGFIPDERSGVIAGALTVIDKDADSGKEVRIDCTKMGSGAYSIPNRVEELRFDTKARFILAIETGGMFQRLVKHNFWKKHKCILVGMGGVPTRATRRFIRRLSDERDIPVHVFTDGDPYGWLNIYRTLKVGSGNAAHINKYFCVPKATFFGITADDIEIYKLPTHPLKEIDIKRVKDGLKNDPFVKHHKPWQMALKRLMQLGVRAEQQALAIHGLNFVISDYLPEKLENEKSWLP